MVAKPRLGTYEKKDAQPWHENGSDIGYGDRSIPRENNCSAENNRKGTERRFDAKSIDVVVPPSAFAPRPAQIGVVVAFVKFVLLHVDAEHKIARQRNRQLAQYRIREPIASNLGFLAG